VKVAIDSSVLVGLINPGDLWLDKAVALRRALLDDKAELYYFDCVVAESISVVVGRLAEKGYLADVEALFDQLDAHIPAAAITWILPDVPRLYPEIINLIRSSSGALNFHNAIIALACRERAIPAIASFDADFDQITWLRCLARPEDVTA
jgi:predicted nucleic acid-binding protein